MKKNIIQFWRDLKMVPEMAKVRSENEGLRSELEREYAKYTKLSGELKRQQQATKALIVFIHRSHRLNVPFADGSIREMLQKAQQDG